MALRRVRVITYARGVVGFGGPGVMLAAIAATAVILGVVALVAGPRVGWDRALGVALTLGSVVCLFVITLVPANGSPGIIPAELAQTQCSLDYGGPAPDGFWIVSGGQRLLNAAVFVPSAALLTWTLSRFWRGPRLVALAVLGTLGLIGCSVLIEFLQLELTRLGRACDVTDIVDNATGAVLGALLGLAIVAVQRLLSRCAGSP